MHGFVAQLAHMTVEELDEVIRTAQGLRQFAVGGVSQGATTAGNAHRGTDPYDFVLGALAEACKRRGVAVLPVEGLKQSRLYKRGFREAIVPVHEFITSFAKGRQRQHAVYRLAYGHMIERYKWGAVRMLGSTSLVPRMLDEMLPGYYQAGLMLMVMERMADGP